MDNECISLNKKNEKRSLLGNGTVIVILTAYLLLRWYIGGYHLISFIHRHWHCVNTSPAELVYGVERAPSEFANMCGWEILADFEVIQFHFSPTKQIKYLVTIHTRARSGVGEETSGASGDAPTVENRWRSDTAIGHI